MLTFPASPRAHCFRQSVKPRIFIETTVVSYLTARPTRDLIALARQEMTRAWWNRRSALSECVISQLVLDEAAAGDAFAARQRLAAVLAYPLLAGGPADHWFGGTICAVRLHSFIGQR